MEESVLKTLELDKILAQVADCAESSLGRERVLALRPLSERAEIERQQEETQDAVHLLLSEGDPPLYGIFPVRASLKRAALGGVLSMGELLHIAESLRVAEALSKYATEENGAVTRQMRNLFLSPGLQQEISNDILSEDTLADTASHTLYSIRQSIRSRQDQGKRKLAEIQNHLAQAGILNENLITMRDGRYVLPVKASNRNQVKGIVHDASGTGQTVYIEPMALVDLNNEIRSLQSEEQEEIQRILAGLSMSVAEFETEIAGNEQALAYLDFTFAKAKYALQTQSSRPFFTEDRTIDVKQARHPLLGKHVVPIDILLGDEFNTLIITGPNTGGKTVTLKTLGLLQAMGQAGLQIPARSESKLGIFTDIFADIGDKQSIELSLSTFSASMTNIVDILSKADRGALLLFDEIGSGTDPTEGAAMAMAILQRITDYDIRTVATTHYAELKLFAIRENRVQNASVEFNVETLSPTYRLLIGLPGRSNAFEIAKRLGLSEEILEEAQSYLDHGSIRFENVLAEIEQSRRETEEERVKMTREREAYREKLQQMQRDLEEAQAAYDRRMEQSQEQADQIVREARETAQEMIRSAKGALEGDRPHLDRALNEVHEKSQAFSKKHRRKAENTRRKGPRDLRIGEKVKILSMNEAGILVEGPARNGDVKVQMGILKVSSNVKDLARVQEEQTPMKQEVAARPSNSLSAQKTMAQTMELDIRGKRFEEAMDIVDKYLDDSVLSAASKVRIIHGKGTGALRTGLHERLKKDRRVASFEFADAREGGTGVTDVLLK